MVLAALLRCLGAAPRRHAMRRHRNDLPHDLAERRGHVGRRRVRRAFAGAHRRAEPGQAYDNAAKTGWVSREQHVTIVDRQPFAFVDFQLDRDRECAAGNGTARRCMRSRPIRSGRRWTAPPCAARTGGKLISRPAITTFVVETADADGSRGTSSSIRETMTNVVLRAGGENDDRTVVVAPTSNYLPATDVVLDGKRITIRHNGHLVNGSLGDSTMTIDGDPMTFDAAPAVIAGKLLLPLDLYVRIGAVPCGLNAGASSGFRRGVREREAEEPSSPCRDLHRDVRLPDERGRFARDRRASAAAPVIRSSIGRTMRPCWS